MFVQNAGCFATICQSIDSEQRANQITGFVAACEWISTHFHYTDNCVLLNVETIK